ncbi:MAG TPA: hypothetical protein P5123_05780 [Spirochaetota bacterium]|nr:hypothetical protein [Spirochaetota bacterium]
MKKTTLLFAIFILTAVTGCGQKSTQQNRNMEPLKEENIGVVNRYHPVLIAWESREYVFSAGYIVGGSRDKLWYSLDDFDIHFMGKKMDADKYKDALHLNPVKNETDLGQIDLAKGDETFVFYAFNKRIGSSKIKNPGIYTQWSTSDLMFGTFFKPISCARSFLIGVNGTWNALPRAVKPINKGNNYLVDLDGDEEIEKIGFERCKDKGGCNAARVTFVFHGKTLHSDGYSVPADYDYYQNCVAEWLEIFPIDLNGDGKMELVIKAVYGYGVSVDVYEVRPNRMVQIMTFYDGD